MDSKSSFDELWDRALNKYLISTGRNLEEKALLKMLHTPEDLSNKLEADRDEAWNTYIQSTDCKLDGKPLLEKFKKLKQFHKARDLSDQLQADHREFTTWREKHSRLTNTLKSMVGPFIVCSSIASSAISLSPFAPASVVLGAVTFLVNAAGGVSEAYNWIEELFVKLGDFTMRLQEYVEGEMNTNLKEKVVDVLSCLLEILALSENAIKAGRWREWTAVVFLGRDEGVKEAFDKLAKLFEDEQRLVIAISYATNQKMNKKVDSLLDSAERMGKRLDSMNSAMLEVQSETRVEQQKTLLEKYLLSSAHDKSQQRYNEHAERALESSGEWLLAEDKFRDWTNREAQFLWISGGPGTGKSYLSSIAIKHIKTLYPQDSKHPNRTSVAYFYVKEDDEELQSLSSILKSLAYQISEVDSVYRNYVVSMLNRPDSVVTPRKIWHNLFLEFYKSRDLPNATLIVLDGLDEAPSQTLKELFLLLDDGYDDTRSLARLSLAFFSRPEVSEYFEPKLRRALSTVEIGEKNESDIALFVKKHVTEITVVRETMRLKSKAAAVRLAREIRDKVMMKADGMFFKVVLIMNQLRDKERVSAVFDSIEDAPPQLEAMIARIFERLTSNEDINRDDLRELLLLISFAKRPLLIAEIYAGLKARTGQAYDALESRLRGRFASLFRLITKWSQNEGRDTHEEAPPETTIAENDTFDIDDFPLEENDEEQQDDDYALSKTETQTKEFEPEDGLSKETLIRFYSTEVRFAHASIRDFVVKPILSDLTCSAASMGIALDPKTAELHMVLLCLETVSKSNPRTWKDGLTLRSYAASHLADHLMSLNPSVLGTNEKYQVLQRLLEVFFYEDGLKKLISVMLMEANKMLHQFFIDRSFADSIRTHWLKQANKDCCSQNELDWIARAIQSRREFFRPLAVEASKMWLIKEGDGDLPFVDRTKLFYIWLIYLFLKMDDNSTTIDPHEIGGFTAFYPPTYDLDELDEIVNLAEVEKTAHYYASSGGLLFLSEQHDAALENFDKAIELDSSSWVALQGASKCLVKKKNYDQAAARLQEAMKLVPPDSSSLTSQLQSDLIEMMMSKNDYRSALQYAKQTYEKYPDVDIMILHVRCLYALRDFKEIVNIIKDFQSSKDGADPYAFFSLRGACFEISGSLSYENSITLIQPMVSKALESCDSNNEFIETPWWAAHVAEFMYHGYDDTTASMELFERIASPKFKSDLSPELQWTYDYLSSTSTKHLALIYYDRAVTAHNCGQDTSAWVGKLRKLATSEDKQRGSVVYQMNDSAYMLGIYLRKYAKVNESDWKACFRNPIVEGLDMLSDEDPLNDINAYVRLVTLLMAAGDVQNASAVSAVILTEYTTGEDTEVRKALKAINFQGPFLKCDGLCSNVVNTYGTDYRELHTCTECLSTHFCQDCFPLLKKGEMPKRVCNPKHEFIQILPVPEEVKGIAARFDGKTMQVQKEWLDALRKKWSL